MPETPLVQSVERAIDLLEVVAGSDDGATLAALAEALGLKRPTVHNLARTLVARGLLERLADPVRYRVGPGVNRLAASADGRSLHARAARAMRALRPRMPAAGWVFAEERDGEIERVSAIHPHRPHVVRRPHWGRCHPYHSALTLTFHAFADTDRRDAYRKRYPPADYGPPAFASDQQLTAFLAAARAAGYANPARDASGHFRLAAPVFGPGHAFAGALGAYVGPDETDADRAELIRLTVTAAAELSAATAGPPPSTSDDEIIV